MVYKISTEGLVAKLQRVPALITLFFPIERYQNMTSAVLLLTFTLTFALEQIEDGETIFIDTNLDPDVSFLYRSPESPSASDLCLSVTLYSATESLQLCVTLGQFQPQKCDYQASGIFPGLAIPAKQVNTAKKVYAFLICGKCRYRLTAVRDKAISLKLDKAIFMVLDGSGKAEFRYKRRISGDHVLSLKSRTTTQSLHIESEDWTCVRQWDDSVLCEVHGNREESKGTVVGSAGGMVSIVGTM